MNARRRLRRARIASPDLNASAFVIETAITDNAPPFNQPWPPTGLGDGWHAIDKFSTRQRTFWRRIRVEQRGRHPARVIPFGDDMKGCIMAFGKRKTGGGESHPLLKWDGREGRLYTQDREQQKNGEWQSVQNDVTDGLVAAFNIASIEHGWMRFPKGAAPETVMVPMREDVGEMPEGENWQEGLRLQVKMPGEDFWRTMMSTAIGLWRSLDRLDDQYVELAPAHPGKVPVVELLDVTEIKARTTSYMPSFGITGWIGPDEVLQRPTRGDLDDEIPF